MKTFTRYDALNHYPKLSGLRFANIVRRCVRQIITPIDYQAV